MKSVTRNFRVRGAIKSMFTPPGGSPQSNYYPNMLVELWHKSPLEIIFLGSGTTKNNGEFIIDFQCESPNVIINHGKIDDVFMKVYYNNQLVAGEADLSEGSFD